MCPPYVYIMALRMVIKLSGPFMYNYIQLGEGIFSYTEVVVLHVHCNLRDVKFLGPVKKAFTLEGVHITEVFS